MKAIATDSIEELRNKEDCSPAEGFEVQESPDVMKLWRLLSKLNPLYALTHPFRIKTAVLQRIVRSVMAVYLSFGLLVTPLLASTESTLPPDLTGPPIPTMTLEQSMAKSTETVSPSTTPSPEDSFLSGPLAAATVEESAAQTPAYYVSNTGSDTADGSAENPWNSIPLAVSKLKAGDTLHIKEGVYNVTGGATFAASGTSDAYITIQGDGNVVIDGKGMNAYTPAFDTKGQDYIRFNNLTVNNARDAVEVSPGSSYVEIDGLKTDRNHFAVKINGGDHITVRNVVATNSRNAFRTENTAGIVPSNILFENIDARYSQDKYTGYETRYRNGDGFILEAGNNITLRNIISADNWDGGFDIKANNVLLENVVAYGNKNNFKIWGNGIVAKNALSYGAKYMATDPVAGEGNGVNARMGSVKFINSTFVDNEAFDIKVDNDGGPANVTFENSIIARKIGGEIYVNLGGSFTDKNNLWYWQGHSDLGLTINSTSIGADPKFVNWDGKDFRLQSSSPAVNFGSPSSPATTTDLDGNDRVMDGNIDAGAYEYQGLSVPDTTVPVISAVSSASVTSSGAVINWTTNEPSDSQVQYRVKGTTAWLATGINASLVTSHSLNLSGLVAGSVYEYQVKSKDQAGNLATQGTISSFTTLTGTTPPPPTTCTTAICGVTDGQTVSGTIQVQPNLTLNPDIRKVAYYLNGSLSTREYTSPFTWGGTGFDTTKLANGTYSLSGSYTTSTGDKNFSFQLIVKNGATVDTTVPVISAVSSASVTSSGAVINWTTNEPSDSQVQYRVKGTTAWLATGINASLVTSHSLNLSGLTAGSVYEYQVKSKDQAGNLATQGTISSFTTLTGTTPPPPTTCTTAICGVTDGQTVSGTIKVQPNLTLNPDIRKVAYYLNGSLSTREYTSPFTWGGTGFDTTKLANGTYTLSGAYTTSTGDKNFSFQLIVKNGATVDTTVPVISAVSSASVTSSGAVINWTTNEPSDSQVQYRVKGTTTWLATGINASLVTSHSLNLSGLTAGSVYEYQVKSKDQAGNLATQSVVSSFTTLTPPTVCTTAMCGVTDGQTVSGTIVVKPNLTLNPDIKKVAYYLNGSLSTREYTSPFTWGGTGFDTTKLANGTYTLSGAYTTSAGDVSFSFIVTVKN